MSRVSARRRRRRRLIVGTILGLAALMAGDAYGAVDLGKTGVSGRPTGTTAGPAGVRSRPGRSGRETATSTSTPTSTSTSTARVDPGLAPGQYLVTGRVSSLSAGQAIGPAIPTPMLITVPVRGAGSGYFYNVTVSNAPGNTIYWNSGEPLGLIGQGALELGRANVTVTPAGATWYLDGGDRRVEPGNYEAAAPVAVGTSGLANPEPDADFRTGPDSVLVTTGGAIIQRPPGPLHLVGPGALRITGALTVATRSGTTHESGLDLRKGGYEIQLTPASGALSIRATIQGRVTLQPSS